MTVFRFREYSVENVKKFKFKVLELFLSFLIGSITALTTKVVGTYQAESKEYGNIDLNFSFIVKVVETFYSSIFTSIKLFFMLPIFLILPVIYLTVIYKIFKSENDLISKYRLFLLTLVFFIINIVTYEFLTFLVM